MASLGEKLKQRRESLNLTQRKVADEVGVTHIPQVADRVRGIFQYSREFFLKKAMR